MGDMTIGRILETKGCTKVFTVPENTTLFALAQKAADMNVGALLIADPEGKLIGIVSERDIMRQVAKRTDLDTITAGEIMTRNLITIGPDEDVNKAMDLMIKKKIRHLPVMSQNTPVGLITVRDLLYSMRKADEEEIRMLVEYLQTNLDNSETVT